MNGYRFLASGFSSEKEEVKVNSTDTMALFAMDSKGSITKDWGIEIPSPSYLCQSEDLVFAAAEHSDYCILYSFIKENEGLKLMDQKKVPIKGVCHLDYLKKSKILIASSYAEGIVFTIGVDQSGFGQVISQIQQGTNAVGETRVHCALATKDEAYVYVTNIADDKVYRYKNNEGRLDEVEILSLKAGCGPRHLAFGSDESKLYVITEYSNEIILLDLTQNKMTTLQYISLDMDKSVEENAGSSIAIDTEKAKLYGALRGSDIISVYDIGEDGQLTRAHSFKCGGHWPRHIALLDQGATLAVANKLSKDIVFIDLDKISDLDHGIRARIDFGQVSFIEEFKER